MGRKRVFPSKKPKYLNKLRYETKTITIDTRRSDVKELVKAAKTSLKNMGFPKTDDFKITGENLVVVVGYKRK